MQLEGDEDRVICYETHIKLTQNDHVVNHPISVSECQRGNRELPKMRTHRMNSDTNGILI